MEDIFFNTKKELNLTIDGKLHTIKITIPKGVKHNKKVKYANITPNNFDLYVTFILNPHKEYRADEYDLYIRRDINLKTALFGGDIIINTLDKKCLKLYIRAGTQSGTKIKIPNQGLLPSGDLFVEVLIKIPALGKDDLDKKLNEL